MRSIIQKAGDGYARTKDSFAKLGENIGEKIGGKDGGAIGRMVGDSIGDKTPAPYIGATSEALIGDNFFECPQCGHKWTLGEETPSKIRHFVEKTKTSMEEKPILRSQRGRPMRLVIWLIFSWLELL